MNMYYALWSNFLDYFNLNQNDVKKRYANYINYDEFLKFDPHMKKVINFNKK